MGNKKLTDTQDTVNKLPVEIISRILKCLPLHDSMKLCCVSSSWFAAWKGLPELRFDSDFFAAVVKSETPTTDEFNNILSVIMLTHVGFITKFYLDIPELETSKEPNFAPWLSYLSRNNVKDISITNVDNPPLRLSHYLFSCVSLEKLSLDNCVLNILPYFKVFQTLKILEFDCVIFMGNSVSYFITRCPVLENLTLNQCEGFQSMDINAPNLKYLTISGNFEFLYLRSAENLIDVSIALTEMVPSYQTARTHELIAYLVHSCKIENLSFGDHFCKFLTAAAIGGMFPTFFRCLKSLQLSNIEANDLDAFLLVFGIIRSCPVVEELQISFSSKDNTDHKLYFDHGFELPCLLKVHLSSVTGVKMERKLIKILLGCSPFLELMSVKSDEKITRFLKSRLTRSLIAYRRASPDAKVVYEDC